jgi:hypothetical protein
MFMAQSAHAAYGDLPTQPDDPEYVPPEEPPVDVWAPKVMVPSKPSPIDWELAAFADYLTAPIRGGTNPFGLGFGGRVGLSVHGFYVGLTAADYLGGSDVNLSDQAFLIGAEIGYGAVLHDFESLHMKVLLRPMLGVGEAGVSHTDPSIVSNFKPDVVTTASGRSVSGGRPSATVTVSNVYVRPKLSLIVTHAWQFIAIEGDVLVIPGIGYGGADPSTWLCYGAQVDVGVRF